MEKNGFYVLFFLKEKYQKKQKPCRFIASSIRITYRRLPERLLHEQVRVIVRGVAHEQPRNHADGYQVLLKAWRHIECRAQQKVLRLFALNRVLFEKLPFARKPSNGTFVVSFCNFFLSTQEKVDVLPFPERKRKNQRSSPRV